MVKTDDKRVTKFGFPWKPVGFFSSNGKVEIT